MSQDALTPSPHAVAEQFHSFDQQREVTTLGMWTFLATEVLFFGGLFVAYAVYRHRFPEDFRNGSLDLKWYLGAFNTAVLLLSSYSMALAVHASQRGDNSRVARFVLITMALATLFLAVKGTEYRLEYEEGLLPGNAFRVEAPPEAERPFLARAFSHAERAIVPTSGPEHIRTKHEMLFMVFYFITTAIHATHMIVGLGLMLWVLWLARRRRFSEQWHNPVEVIGLYWHFVDTVWIFLFPMLYLLRNS